MDLKVYKWTLKNDIKFKKLPHISKITSIIELGKFGLISNGNLIIKKGYSWDGCSPKVKIFGKVIGTWDGFKMKNGKQRAYHASLAHDILCQYEKKVPLSREKIDLVFLYLLEKYDFTFPKTYYFFVSMFRKFKSFL